MSSRLDSVTFSQVGPSVGLDLGNPLFFDIWNEKIILILFFIKRVVLNQSINYCPRLAKPSSIFHAEPNIEILRPLIVGRFDQLHSTPPFFFSIHVHNTFINKGICTSFSSLQIYAGIFLLFLDSVSSISFLFCFILSMIGIHTIYDLYSYHQRVYLDQLPNVQ